MPINGKQDLPLIALILLALYSEEDPLRRVRAGTTRLQLT